jgi:hypothetical protein
MSFRTQAHARNAQPALRLVGAANNVVVTTSDSVEEYIISDTQDNDKFRFADSEGSAIKISFFAKLLGSDLARERGYGLEWDVAVRSAQRCRDYSYETENKNGSGKILIQASVRSPFINN